jgi:hypothetical protein
MTCGTPSVPHGRAGRADADAAGVDGPPDHTTTLIYADYAPSAGEADLVERAFGHSARVRAAEPASRVAGEGQYNA